jgi:HD-GYP domain-containing protein (c-di-GMP phosphodiesterase class II)
MSKQVTLLIEPNKKIAPILALNLQLYAGLDVVIKETKEAAREWLLDHKDQFLILARTAPQVRWDWVKDSCPLILIGEGESSPKMYTQIINSLDIKSIVKSAATAVHVTAKEMAESEVPDFFPIEIDYFKVLSNTNCAIHVKKEDSYPIVFTERSLINGSLVEKLKNSGNSHLYVFKADRLKIVNLITAEYIATLSDEDLNTDEQLLAQESNFKLVAQKLVSFGVQEQTIEIAKKSMEKMQESLEKYPKISVMLRNMLKNQASYLFQHTQVATYLSLHIMKNTDWGTDEQKSKIAFIAFFHDIALETDEQAKINTHADFVKCTLPKREKDLIDKHAQIASEIVLKYPMSPIGVDQLIRQHHGNLNGVGFSEHFGGNISPITLIFMIAEELSHMMLTNPPDMLDKSQLISDLRATFPTSRFKKIIDILETLSM